MLARVIVDRDKVSLSAEGVTTLVRLLRSGENNTIILAGWLIACEITNISQVSTLQDKDVGPISLKF